MKQDVLLQMTDICKEFPGVKALDHVSLTVKAGTVHALMGENGAGKSTLMKCLFGIYDKDSGKIELEGKEINFKNSKEALENGVAMVHQELNQALKRNVMDNLWLGRYPKVGGVMVNEKKIYDDTKKVFEELKIDVDPKRIMSTMPVSQRQMVEIAKAVSVNAKVIVFDEPTSSLTEQEVEHLFDIIEMLKKRGCGIIYISHKMAEIKRISDEITIMRDGTWVATEKADDLEMDDIIRLMVGREVTGDYYRADYGEKVSDEVVLSVKNVTVPGIISDISFDLHKGEMLGFGGLSESGMHEVGKAIFGASYVREGTVTLADGTQINDIPTAIKHSIAYTSKDRDNESVVMNQSIGDNICLPSLDELSNKAHFISDKKKKKFANKYAKQMSVKMVNTDQFVSDLSGGNKQKVVLARWIGKDSDIIVLDSPTRGIDIKVKQDIYQLMNQMRKEGKSIIMISEELMELIGMCDRIIIMKDGKINGELERNQDLNENSLITMMV